MLDYNFFQSVELAMKYVIYGDTDSLYINIPNLIPNSPQEALQHAEEIGDEINQQVRHYTEKYLLPKMGIDPQYNETLFKTELVCDGMLLLPVKKNYAYSLLAIEGKIVENKTIEYTGIVKKSDIPPLTKDFIKDMIEDIIFNKSLRGKNLITEINGLAIKYNQKLNLMIDNLDIKPFATPKKWGNTHNEENTPWQIIAMRLYNTVMDEHVFSPMTAGMTVPIQILNPIEFETKIAGIRNKHKRYLGNIPLANLSKIAIPYSHNIERIKQVMNYYGIVIDKALCWKLVLNTVAMHIIDTVKKHHNG